MARNLFLGILVVAWAFLLLASVDSQSARAGTETIVVDDQPTPDGRRLMVGARPFGINNAGQVAIRAVLPPSFPRAFRPPVDRGIYLYKNGVLTEVAEGHKAIWPYPEPDLFWIHPELAFDQQGRIAFTAELWNTGGQPEVFVSSKNGSLTSLAAADEPVKRTKGEVTISGGLTVEAISNNGKVAFSCRLSDGSEALFVASKGQAKRVAWENQPAPDGNAILIPDEVLGLDDENHLFFTAEILTADGEDDEMGIYMATPGELVEIFRPGRPAPAGDGVFRGLFNYGLVGMQVCDVNAAGRVVFVASVARDDGTAYSGVFTASQDGCVEVLRSTDRRPDGQYPFGPFFGVVIADEGSVGALTLAGGPGIYVVSDQKTREIAGWRTPVPGVEAVFDELHRPVMSPGGTIAFAADLRSRGGQEQTAIYLVKDGDLIEVARDGADVRPEGTDYYKIVTSDIYVNDAGQVTYAIEAYSQDQPTGGVFLFTP